MTTRKTGMRFVAPTRTESLLTFHILYATRPIRGMCSLVSQDVIAACDVLPVQTMFVASVRAKKEEIQRENCSLNISALVSTVAKLYNIATPPTKIEPVQDTSCTD